MNIQPDPKYLVDFLNANVDNKKLSAEVFREIVRNTLPLYTPETDDDDDSKA